VGAPLCLRKADVLTTLGHPARTRGADMLTGSEPAAVGMLARVRPDMGHSSAVPGVRRAAYMDGAGRRGPAGVAMRMTQQYLAGELSVLLAHVQAVTTSKAAGRDAWSLRHAAETAPIQALGSVTVRALALTEGLCWESLNRGDAAAFTRQAAVCAELHEFGVCAGLLKEA
jgi:hypothetical protein